MQRGHLVVGLEAETTFSSHWRLLPFRENSSSRRYNAALPTGQRAQLTGLSQHDFDPSTIYHNDYSCTGRWTSIATKCLHICFSALNSLLLLLLYITLDHPQAVLSTCTPAQIWNFPLHKVTKTISQPRHKWEKVVNTGPGLHWDRVLTQHHCSLLPSLVPRYSNSSFTWVSSEVERWRKSLEQLWK